MQLLARVLKDAHAQALAAALPRLSGLRERHLGWNDIGAAGAGALTATLPRLSQLQELHLHDNSIGDAAKQATRAACCATCTVYA